MWGARQGAQEKRDLLSTLLHNRYCITITHRKILLLSLLYGEGTGAHRDHLIGLQVIKPLNKKQSQDLNLCLVLLSSKPMISLFLFTIPVTVIRTVPRCSGSHPLGHRIRLCFFVLVSS